MKKAFLVLAAFLTAAPAFAAEVTGARVSANNGTLEVDVGYSGGCGNKTVKLEVSDEWAMSSPSQGTARIVEQGFDACEMFVRKTVVFSLKDSGLAYRRLRGATLTIYGETTSAQVILPYEL
jgi:uncharacterized protein YdeI (BOF family)